MLRHSLNLFLRERREKCSKDEDSKKIIDAEKYLNAQEFHKRLRNGSDVQKVWLVINRYFLTIFYQNLTKNRVNNDNSSKAKVYRDQRSDWKIKRGLQRGDKC